MKRGPKGPRFVWEGSVSDVGARLQPGSTNSKMAITREEVLHVARLARLELIDEEIERFTEQLSAILEAVAKVSELDLVGVEPTAHPLDLVNVWAEDEPRPCLPVEEALANAPEREAGFFKVPPA